MKTVTRDARRANRFVRRTPAWWRWAKATAHRAERRKMREYLSTRRRVRNLGIPRLTGWDVA